MHKLKFGLWMLLTEYTIHAEYTTLDMPTAHRFGLLLTKKINHTDVNKIRNYYIQIYQHDSDRWNLLYCYRTSTVQRHWINMIWHT